MPARGGNATFAKTAELLIGTKSPATVHSPQRGELRAHARSNKEKRALTNACAHGGNATFAKTDEFVIDTKSPDMAHSPQSGELRAHARNNKEKRALNNACLPVAEMRCLLKPTNC